MYVCTYVCMHEVSENLAILKRMKRHLTCLTDINLYVYIYMYMQMCVCMYASIQTHIDTYNLKCLLEK